MDLTLRFFQGKLVTEIEIDDIKKFLDSDISGSIIEAGAYDGRDSLIYAKNYINSRIMAIEPQSKAYKFLEKTTRGVSNIECYKTAFSDNNGYMNLHVSSHEKHDIFGSSSLRKPKLHVREWPDIKFDSIEIVKTLTLDSFCEMNMITNITLLKLDTQGNELKILENAQILKKCSAILLEINRIELYENSPKFRQLHKLLKRENFRLAINRVGPRDGNALYIKKDIFKSKKFKFYPW